MTGSGDISGMSGAGAVPMEAWAPTAEQKHNLQLLELTVKLREALLGIPALVTPPAAAAAPASSVFGAGGGGDAAATAAAAAAAAAESAAHAAECKERVAEAVKALDETASRVFLDPYLCGVARALEDIVSKMHRWIHTFIHAYVPAVPCGVPRVCSGGLPLFWCCCCCQEEDACR